MGTVGGNPSRAWIYDGSFHCAHVTHELGHNLGLYHSHGLDCGAMVLGDGCTSIEYGDTADLMGGPTAHFNAFQKDRLGWLGYDASPPISTVGSSGIYTIEPYETAGTNPKALKIPQSEDPASGQRTWYYLEYRQPTGFDSWLGDVIGGNVTDGVLVHTGSESSGNTSFLLDMTPEPDSWWDPALTTDQSYTDVAAGVTITIDQADGFGATVSVSLAATTCARANPKMALSPAESLWLEPGTPASFTVTVTNQDSADCTDAAFDLLSAVPSGWTATFAAGSLTLAPGSSDSTTVTVTSPVSAPDGFYDVTITAEHGTDFSLTASATATYVVSAAVNQAPVASDDASSTDADTAVTIAVLANDSDPDGDPLTVSAVTASGNGSCRINGDGTLTYTPAAGFAGTDAFTYAVSDGNGGSDSATVTVTVSGVNGAPVANDDSATTDADTAVTIDVVANDSDPDGDPLTVAALTQGNNGAVAIAGGGLSYTPNGGFTGTDSFRYTVSDGNGGSDGATVTVTVSGGAVNGAPVANDDSATTDADTAVTIDVVANDSDPDGDPLTVSSVTQGANGAVAIAGGGVSYTPNGGFAGTDSFRYTVTDGQGGSAGATVTVTVSGTVNGAPVANDDSATTGADTAVTIDVVANDSDPDGDPLTVSSVTQGANGAVAIAGGGVSYTPNGGFAGTDSFSYTVTDGQGGSAGATVTVTVQTAGNQTPQAVDDAVATESKTPVTIGVLINDWDPDGDPLTVTSVSNGVKGTVTINADSTVTYTPGPKFKGSDNFTYVVSDGLSTAVAAVSVHQKKTDGGSGNGKGRNK